MIPLGLLCSGEQGEIVSIRVPAETSGDREKNGIRMEDMGLRIGKIVQVLTNGNGPVLLKVDESRIALARGLAMKIMVRR